MATKKGGVTKGKKSGTKGGKKSGQKRPAKKGAKSGGDVRSGGQSEVEDGIKITLKRETAVALLNGLVSNLGMVGGRKKGGGLVSHESAQGDEGSRGW